MKIAWRYRGAMYPSCKPHSAGDGGRLCRLVSHLGDLQAGARTRISRESMVYEYSHSAL